MTSFPAVGQASDPLPACPVCRRAAAVVATVGNVVLYRYKCKHAAEYDERQVAAQVDEAYLTALRRARLGAWYRHAAFGTFISSYDETTLAACRTFCDDAAARRAFGIVLYSQRNGNGKTHLAVSMVKELLHHGMSGLFIRAGEVVTVDRGPMQWAGVLALDDLFKLSSRQALELLYDVLDVRAAQQKTTIITTNVTQAQAEFSAGPYAHIVSSIYSRISAYRVIEMHGQDYRPHLAV